MSQKTLNKITIAIVLDDSGFLVYCIDSIILTMAKLQNI